MQSVSNHPHFLVDVAVEEDAVFSVVEAVEVSSVTVSVVFVLVFFEVVVVVASHPRPRRGLQLEVVSVAVVFDDVGLLDFFGLAVVVSVAVADSLSVVVASHPIPKRL
ncbi:hypothetical protein BC941DRAFT_420973 [Chlamydoabsidia padenii]|nr:hypothetical protein BC941DRAFT_420973 [Chlamydoabsidia padenii]